MAEWTGKSKGTLLGYKIFTFLIKKIGLRFAYFILSFVSLYYVLFSWKSNRAIFYYFKNCLRYSLIKSIFSVCKSYYIFGQTLIDRVTISSGMLNKFTYEFEGVENILSALKSKSGGVLISAHVGNFEISEYFFAEGHSDIRINVLTTDLERKSIKAYLEGLSIDSKAKHIALGDDFSHIFAMNEALGKNEFVCLTGDRFTDGSKYFEAKFLGKKAKFPAGPFIIASKLKVPVIFVYVMKDSAFHYHLYGFLADVDSRKPRVLFDNYIENLSSIVKKYPYQWFNYYQFWS
jgi:predicted LPLAT superfamily acyltransferase